MRQPLIVNLGVLRMFYFEVFNAFYDDMISMKKASNRPKDLSDLAMLKEAHKIMEQSDE